MSVASEKQTGRGLVPRSPGTVVALKVVVVLFALGGLMYPRNQISTVQLLIALPLAATALWHRGDHAFKHWAIFSVAFVTFVTLRGIADDTGLPVRFQYVLDVDRALGGGELLTHRLQRLLYHKGSPSLFDFFSLFIYLSFFAMPTVPALVLWLARAKVWPRFMLAAAITWAISTVIVLLVPTAPPWLAADQGFTGPLHRIVHELISIQNPEAYRYGERIAGHNNVAAMPSLHFAMAWLVVLGLWSWHWTLRLPAVLYGLWMGFALVYLGEHYLADVVVGGLIVHAAWGIAGRFSERLPAAPAPAGPEANWDGV